MAWALTAAWAHAALLIARTVWSERGLSVPIGLQDRFDNPRGILLAALVGLAMRYLLPAALARNAERRVGLRRLSLRLARRSRPPRSLPIWARLPALTLLALCVLQGIIPGRRDALITASVVILVIVLREALTRLRALAPAVRLVHRVPLLARALLLVLISRAAASRIADALYSGRWHYQDFEPALYLVLGSMLLGCLLLPPIPQDEQATRR